MYYKVLHNTDALFTLFITLIDSLFKYLNKS